MARSSRSSSPKSAGKTSGGKSSETETSSAVRDTAERSKNRTIIGGIEALFRAAAKCLEPENEPRPARRRQKDGTDTGSFRIAARSIMRRAARLPADAAAKLSEAFSAAKAAVTAAVDGWFAEFFEGEPASLNVLDPTSPHFGAGLGSVDQGDHFETICDSNAGASLEL
jgi:hypothetical protein